MKDFVNETDLGNEPAIRRGKVVPPNGVNIAWAKSPHLSPDKNISIVDFSQLIPENLRNEDQRKRCRLMFANHLGILIDEHGNDIIYDEFPAVTDVFSIDEDFDVDVNIDNEKNFFRIEYNHQHILPYLHVSRYFHVDNAGLTMPGSTVGPPGNSILKIVREDGTEYLNEDGERAYRIELVYVDLEYAENEDPIDINDSALYRVNVYIDTEDAEGLFLQYFKAEYDAGNRLVKEYDLNYRERLNPFKFFSYAPEEAELVDQSYTRFKRYSTKAVGGKAQIYGGGDAADLNGFRVHVPKRAVPDPRIYQLFRWRVRCEFIDSNITEETEGGGWTPPTNPTSPGTPTPTAPAPIKPRIKAGVLYHSDLFLSAAAPLAWLNLSASNVNMHNIEFVNPLSEAAGKSRYTKDYWLVNMGTTTMAQLAEFDVIIIAPYEKQWTMHATWYSYLISHFVQASGGTLIFDMGNDTYMTNSPFPQFSAPIMPSGNMYTTYGGTLNYAVGSSLYWSGQDGRMHPIIAGSSRLAGYNLSTIQPTQLSLRTKGYYGTKNLQWFGPPNIIDIPGAGWAPWRPVLVAPRSGNADLGTALAVTNGGLGNGTIVFTTLGIADDASRYFDAAGKIALDPATSVQSMPSASTIQSAMATNLNRSFLADPYKLLYNIALYSVRNKNVVLSGPAYGNLGVNQSNVGAPVGGGYTDPNVESGEFSTTWTGYSKWYTSYVIDGEVLTEEERDELGFTLAPYAENSNDVVWQRRLTNQTMEQIINDEIGPAIVARMGNATRQYHIDVSNDAVKVPQTVLYGANAPYAYTDAYSPPFVVPEELGAHVIKGEEIEELYAPDTGTSATYPPRPYKYRVDSIIPTVDAAVPQTATITITGEAIKTTETETPVNTNQGYMNWFTHGENSIDLRPIMAHYNMPYPRGIHTWQYSNFGRTTYGTGSENWINPGLFDNVDDVNKNPVTIKYAQKLLNLFKFWNFYAGPAGYNPENGIMDTKTKTNLINFQANFQLKQREGRINMETIGALAAQTLRMRHVGQVFDTAWASDPSYKFIYDTIMLCHLKNISDGNTNSAWLKTTYVKTPSKTPAVAWDFVGLRFPGSHEINNVMITPYTRNQAPDIVWNTIHITTTGTHNELVSMLTNYDGSAAQVKNMNKRCPDGVAVKVPVGPITGNTVIIGIGQDRANGLSAKVFGLREFGAFAASTTGGVTNTQTEKIPLTYTKTVTIQPGDPAVMIDPVLPADPSTYTSVAWTNVSSSNTNVSAVVLDTVTGRTEVKNTDVDIYGEVYKDGFVYPDYFHDPDHGRQKVYSMDKVGNISPVPESGFVSKGDGVKLMCHANGTPHLDLVYPAPTSELENEIIKHTEFIITPLVSDPMVTIGFYDKNTQTFLFDASGRSRITLEALNVRGRNNIYVAVASNYQELKDMALPDAAPARLPYKWAMPIYGVCEKVSTRIGIEPISPGLGKLDVWPVGIRTGRFARDVYIRDNLEGALTGWVAAYRGKTVRAFYSVPEMNKVGWSPQLGRPYIDIIDEIPIIIDSNKIKVRQAPIAMEHELIANGGAGRPARPFMVVSVRASSTSPWEVVPWEDILDYKVADGTVLLKNNIPGGQTEENIKISYSTKTEVYPFKYSEGERINLNPYSSNAESYVNKPAYIYILPKVVMGPDGEIVPESIQENTLRFTTDSTIFSPTHPEYNPLAISLGVVYVNNGSDIEKLILLDTRRRGGGVTEELTIADAFADYPESMNYWDISPGSGLSYQNGGFVIVRLPEELKEQFSGENPTEEIKSIISRRLPAGVSFKLETLDGSTWED